MRTHTRVTELQKKKRRLILNDTSNLLQKPVCKQILESKSAQSLKKVHKFFILKGAVRYTTYQI